MHTVIPNEREWLSVLICVNAAGGKVPNFYIFKGKRMRQNFVTLADAGNTMAMQPHTWMTSYLFDAWISHFITALGSKGGISHSNRYLLIFDGHSSHVTLQVVRKAAMAGLDIITLLSHTSHHLQPLDVVVFHPFKCAFRNFRDAWTLQHSKKCARKEDLCGWVCLALQRALSPSNIEKGFRKIGIWPFNSHAIDDKMGPAEAYNIAAKPSDSDGEEAFHGDDLLVPEGEDKVPESQPDEV